MSKELEKLKQLQGSHLILLGNRKALSELEIAADKAKKPLNEIKQQWRGLLEQKNAENRLFSEVETKIQTKERYVTKLKLNQSETKKNDQYQQLEQEQAKCLTEIGELETNALSHLEAQDIIGQEIEQLEIAVSKAEKEHQEVLKEIGKQQLDLKEKGAKLDEKISQQREQVDQDKLDLYDRLVVSRRLPVVVPVNQDRQCQGCHLKVTPATFSKLADKEVFCDQCGCWIFRGDLQNRETLLTQS